jgi:hypothetical protein
MMRVAITLALVVTTPLTARAFGSAGTFESPVSEGGGGGRFFTGSLADGYTCAVCHLSEGAGPALSVRGLPADGYVEGAQYEVELAWSTSFTGLAAEIMTFERRTGGTLDAVSEDAIRSTDRCRFEGVEGPRADSTHRTDAGRELLHVTACGASTARLLWTAPSFDLGPAWLEVAMVASDLSGDPLGDATATHRIALPPFGAPVEVAAVGGGCAVPGHPGGAAPAGLVAFAWIVLGGVRGGSSRRRK